MANAFFSLLTVIPSRDSLKQSHSGVDVSS